MNIVDAVKTCIVQKYVDFTGRARRSEYWYFALATWLVDSVIYFLGNNLGIGFFSILSYLFSLAIFLPTLAVGVRRLHDIGKKGLWLLLLLLPFVGWIILIVWFAKDSDPGVNEYGPNPKE